MAQLDDIRRIIVNRTRLVIQTAALPLVSPNDIQTDDLDKEIDAALRDYSHDEPRVILLDLTEAALTIVDQVEMYKLADWDVDVSDPVDILIEFPIDKVRKEMLHRGDDLDWAFRERPTGVGGAREFYVVFFNPPRDTAGNWRIKYGTRHKSISEDANLSELTTRGVQMVGLLSAVFAARVLAGKFGKTNDPTIAVDTVAYRTKAQEWQSIATTLFDEYKSRISRPKEVKRSGQDMEVIDHDLNLGGLRGRQYLVHRRRRR